MISYILLVCFTKMRVISFTSLLLIVSPFLKCVPKCLTRESAYFYKSKWWPIQFLSFCEAFQMKIFLPIVNSVSSITIDFLYSLSNTHLPWTIVFEIQLKDLSSKYSDLTPSITLAPRYLCRISHMFTNLWYDMEIVSQFIFCLFLRSFGIPWITFSLQKLLTDTEVSLSIVLSLLFFLYFVCLLLSCLLWLQACPIVFPVLAIYLVLILPF